MLAHAFLTVTAAAVLDHLLVEEEQVQDLA
jgi:hypothetical protein